MAGVVDAHRDGKRFIVRADEKLTGRLDIASRVLLIAKRESTAPNRDSSTRARVSCSGYRRGFTQMVLIVRSEGLLSLHLGIFKIGAAFS